MIYVLSKYFHICQLLTESSCRMVIIIYLSNNIENLSYKFKFFLIFHLIIKVCKKWQRPSEQLSWSNVKSLSTLSITHERLGQDYHTEDHIEAVLSKCGQYLQHLTLDCNFDSSIMPIVIKYCRNLTSIYINFHRTYEDDFINAFTNMKKLKSIKMVYWSVPGKNDTSILETLPKTIEKISFGVYPLIISPLAENFAYVSLKINYYFIIIFMQYFFSF